MLITNILEEYTKEKPYLKLTKNNLSQVYHLYKQNGKLQAQIVYLKEAKPKGSTEEEKLSQLQNAVQREPLRAFIEPDNKTLAMLVYRGNNLDLPHSTEKYEYMSPKECYNYLLLKSVGL